MLTEDSAEAEGVVPTDSQEVAEASQVSYENILTSPFVIIYSAPIVKFSSLTSCVLGGRLSNTGGGRGLCRPAVSDGARSDSDTK